MFTTNSVETAGGLNGGRFSLFLVVLFTGLLFGREAAALMVPLATTTLVDRASCIVEGRVTAVASHWTDDRSGIITEVEVDVTDTLIGTTNRVTFAYQGGAVGAIRQHVSDMPEVVAGQQILVFLRKPVSAESRLQRRGRAQAGGYVLVGASQGLCRIAGGRAAKSGFNVAGDDGEIDRNLDADVLKSRIRQRLTETRRKGDAL